MVVLIWLFPFKSTLLVWGELYCVYLLRVQQFQALGRKQGVRVEHKDVWALTAQGFHKIIIKINDYFQVDVSFLNERRNSIYVLGDSGLDTEVRRRCTNKVRSHIFVEEWCVRRCLPSLVIFLNACMLIFWIIFWVRDRSLPPVIILRPYSSWVLLLPLYPPVRLGRFKTLFSILFKARRACTTLIWLLSKFQKVI